MKVRIAISVLIFSQAFLAAQNKKLTMEEMHQLHQDSKAYIAYLEDPQRDVYQKPHEVIMALSLREGETVADIGQVPDTSLFDWHPMSEKKGEFMQWIPVLT